MFATTTAATRKWSFQLTRASIFPNTANEKAASCFRLVSTTCCNNTRTLSSLLSSTSSVGIGGQLRTFVALSHENETWNNKPPFATTTTLTTTLAIRYFSRRSHQGYIDDDMPPRAGKLEARQRSTEYHEKKVEENKQKREKIRGKVGKVSKNSNTKADDDDDDDQEPVHRDADSDDDDNDEATNADGGPVLPDPKKVKERMTKVVTMFEKSLQSIRGAEPSPELLENLRAHVYGEHMALGSVAQVVIVSPTLAHVSCFDPSTVKDVRAALFESALDLNPYVDENDESTLIVPLPRLSQETREKMVKQLNRQAEVSRQRIRRIRQKAIDVCNKGKQGKLEHIGKDDAFRIAKDVESVTQDAISKLNAKVDQKTKSIMQV